MNFDDISDLSEKQTCQQQLSSADTRKHTNSVNKRQKLTQLSKDFHGMCLTSRNPFPSLASLFNIENEA